MTTTTTARQITSVCRQCTKCKHLDNCKGLLRWSRVDCPAWYTRRTVPELYGRVMVRTTTY